MIPYGHQSIDSRDIKEVVAALKSDWLTQGPKIFEFERSLAKYCGAKYAVAVNNGTAALHLAYLAAGLSVGDEIITTPNTFVATTNMLLVVGAQPVFCDIRDDTCNIDEQKIERLINKRTKAIVPVHFAGHPCEMKTIKAIAKKYKLIIIEDACHALGARYKNSKIGGCQYSDMAVFSFHPVKSITSGEGGAILTNNQEYYERLRHLRSHGIKKDKKGFNVMTELGYNYRLSDIQAALGASQIKKIESFMKKRRQVAAWYQKVLGGIQEIILPTETEDCHSAWHIYIIRVKQKQHRMPLYQCLKKEGVGVNFHYPCVYKHPYYQQHGFGGVSCPEAEQYADTAITIPLHTLLKKSEVQYIASKIKNYFYA